MGLGQLIQGLRCASRLALLWVVGVPALAHAESGVEAEKVLRVRSVPHFAATRSTSTSGATSRLEGLLHDEQNAPVSGARIRVSEKIDARACAAGSDVTDEQGRFCLQLPAAAGSASLSFSGDAHFEGTSHTVSLEQSAPAPTLTLQTKAEWFVGQSAPPVVVRVGDPPSGEGLHVQLVVRDAAEAEATRIDAPFDSEAMTLEVDTSQFPAAGPLVFAASLMSGTSELARATSKVDWVAPIELQPEDFPEQVRSGDTFTLQVRASGDKVPLDSGWVELREGDKPLVLAPVREGKAELAVELAGSRERRVSVALEYVAEKPWYRPTPAVQRELRVLGPLPWLHLPWALLAAGAGFWVVRTWRRPSRALFESARAVLGSATHGSVRATSGPTDAWSGTVFDAHDKRPLGEVQVRLFAPSLQSSEPLRACITNSAGHFQLPELRPVPEGARLVFTSRDHSTLNRIAPGPCVMHVELVDRRRTLLSALVDWARNSSLTQVGEPTPRTVANVAHRAQDEQTETWALEIDEAVYGPLPPDAGVEERLLRQRPVGPQSSAKGR